MCMMKAFPYLAVVPISLLLTVSFFVLLIVNKVGVKALKVFGYVVASLLWLAAVVVFLTGFSMLVKSSGCRGPMMHGGMGMSAMQQGGISAMMVAEKSPMPTQPGDVTGQQKPGEAPKSPNRGMIYQKK